MSTNTKEIGFEEHFTNYLTDTTHGNGYTLRHRTNFDKEYLVDQELLFQFLEATQPKAVAALDKSTGGDYKRTLLKEINRTLSQIRFARGMAVGGIINLLRKELVVHMLLQLYARFLPYPHLYDQALLLPSMLQTCICKTGFLLLRSILHIP